MAHGELADLAAVQEQLAVTLGLVIELVGLRVFGNVAADEPHLARLHAGVRFFERDFAVAQAFHFAADEHDAAFQSVEHFVLVTRAAVLSDQPLVVVLLVGASLAFFFAMFGRERQADVRPFPPFAGVIEYKRRLASAVRRTLYSAARTDSSRASPSFAVP